MFLASNYRKTFAEIDLKALAHNYQQVKNLVGKSKIMAVIKADAYGHGLLKLSENLNQADAYAVACVDEGIELRNHGITKLIVILEGYTSSCELDALVENNLSPVINSLQQLDLLANKKLNNKMNIWLKFDTGMHRLGFQTKQLQAIWEKLEKLSSKVIVYGLMSHFANADVRLSPNSDAVNNTNIQQESKFSQVCNSFENYFKPVNSAEPKYSIRHSIRYSMANSAAIINLANSHYDWVRPGIMLYGVNPVAFSDRSSDRDSNGIDRVVNLQAVMTLKSQIIAINNLSKGDCIGYGSDWCCPQDMPIAVVAIGYGDGYPRHAASGTPILIKGIKTQLVGRVSMDMISVDLRPLLLAKIPIDIGDTVTLWGKGLAVEEVADYCSTIAYELLCGISSRVKLKYINETVKNKIEGIL